jgi:hypothetical protein
MASCAKWLKLSLGETGSDIMAAVIATTAIISTSPRLISARSRG